MAQDRPLPPASPEEPAPHKKVVVGDAAEDDYGVVSKHVTMRPVDETYRYRRRNPLWRLVAAFLYYIVVPIPALVIALLHGMRFVNRRAFRQAGGCYAYANHTHWVDVFIPYLLSFPRRAYVVAGPTAVSVPVVRHLVPMLGGVPLNITEAGKAAFREYLADLVRRGHPVAIFPEAHEWPYFNGIRDFPPYSFTYPVHRPAPVIGYVVTYRRRRRLTGHRPFLTVTVGQPIPPETWAGAEDPKALLKEKVHGFMVDTVQREHSFGWVEYDI